MPRLYVANCTSQDLNLTYRMIESKRPHVQPIMAGQQIIVGGADVSLPQAEHLLEQLTRFGMRLVQELSSLLPNVDVPMVGSLDKPITSDIITDVVAHNGRAAFQRGKKFREEAAIAASTNIARTTPDAADTLKVSVQEETPGNAGDGQPPVNEGYHITRRVAA